MRLVQHGAQPRQREALPEHRGRAKRVAVVRVETVEPGLHQRLDRRRYGVVATLAHMPRQLLQKQRVTLGTGDTTLGGQRVGVRQQL